MGKILVYVMLLLATSVMASGINWAKDYNSGMALAKKTNKPVMFIISRDTCKYCVKLDKETFKDSRVINGVNKDFIAIRSWINNKDYVPQELYAPGLPTIWFLLPNGKPMYQPLMGFVDGDNFLTALAIVKTEFDKQKNKKSKDGFYKYQKK